MSDSKPTPTLYGDYVATRQLTGACAVTFGGQPLPPRLDLDTYSPSGVLYPPSGFDWGTYGAGSVRLALAILAHHCQDDSVALARYQAFAAWVVSRLPRFGWTMTTGFVEGMLRNAMEAK